MKVHFAIAVLLAVLTSNVLGGDKNCRCRCFHGKAPPELAAKSGHWMNGHGPATLTDLKGKVVWLQFNFWENCTPMRHHLVKWHEKYADKGLVIIEIDGGTFESLSDAAQHVAQSGVKHRVLWDDQNQNHEKYGIKAWPTAYLLNEDGKVIWQGNPALWVRRPKKHREMMNLIECHLTLIENMSD